MSLRVVHSIYMFYILNDRGLILATEDILLTRPIIFLSISSKVLPWVSGTYKITNTMATTQIQPNNQKAPEIPIESKKLRKTLVIYFITIYNIYNYSPIISWKVFVTMKVHVQLKAVATEAADPLILAGKISPIISHGIGPKPIENPRTYMTKQVRGNHPTELTSPILLFLQ